MELIYTPPISGKLIYITLAITFVFTLYLSRKVQGASWKDKVGGGLFAFMLFIMQVDAKERMDEIQAVNESNCSIKGCVVLVGKVDRFKSYKDILFKNYLTNEFYLDGHKFKFHKGEDAFEYTTIVEEGGVFERNSGPYKLYLYKGKIVKIWRLRDSK
ncbi:hypothetical protein BIT28_27795 [Photobacterium proteolyticum]|uniref:Uncharacterized protein n=1 Tax=Photobacterium proteolyticum TaxID=1903952 RepID=A0A1Q9H7E5_9GAMM|nr:hypothetical protein [Photobacterium proteolyticum]OLQ83752.1 hypothetical protein BIT28_27795 [Photobacterium proteolyticum]